MLKKEASLLVLIFVLFVLIILNVNADFQFNGTVTDESGNFLNNTIINITVRDMTWTIVGYNYTTSNATGSFNLTLEQTPQQTQQLIYEPSITHFNGSFADYKAKTIPAFPSIMLQMLAGTNFYLTPAGTINITAVNSSGARVSFKYQVKDTKLGYPIASNFDTSINETLVYVPSNRNYSIMIYPDRSMPISFSWSNFTSSSSYNFSNGISSYNTTTKTLHKQFNITLSQPRVSGYLNYSGIGGWNEFTVIPFLVEPGNMVHTVFGPMPYNMSGFMNNGVTNNGTDFFNLSNGFYNMSLPATVETSTILLFATARNGSKYYGSFRNLSLDYNTYPTGKEELTQFNFSYTSGLLGTNGTLTTNITMDTSMLVPNKINISTAKQIFNLINATNSTIGNTSAHVEIKVDYSSLGAIEFTWMTDVAQSSSVSNFAVLLLNSTGVKEINVYANGGGSNQYAPKRTSYTVSEMSPHLNGVNITIKTFNPGGIGENIATSSVSINLYKSNSTCDIPNPSTSCLIGGSSQTMATFNPMQSVMGGGKISFRMGTGNILVHYVNVDLIASGPPDALFDSSTNTNSTSGSSFASAVRFGSNGPTIYDYVLVSVPYSETASSGLDDSATVNMSIPLFYDDNWNVIWNTTANGTSASAFAANYSHYSTYPSDWSYLMNQSTCITSSITSATQINNSKPCYIDTTNNKIWVRLPHFSGTGPSVTGSVVSSSSSSSSSSGSGSSSSATGGTSVENLPSNELKESESTTTSLLGSGESFKFNLDKETNHILTVLIINKDSAKIRISSDPVEIELKVNEEKEVDLNNDTINDISVKLDSIVNDIFAKFSLKKLIKEKEVNAEGNLTNKTEEGIKEVIKEESNKNKPYYILLGVIVLIILYFLLEKKKFNS